MKVLITGAAGQLGSDLKAVLSGEYQTIPATRADFDITILKATMDFVKNTEPDVIVHAAAFTEVDGCESQPDKAFNVNGLGTRNMAIAASVNQLFDALDDIVNPGDVVLAYNCIPMLHYVTRTVPALGNPWPTIMTPEKLAVSFSMLNSIGLPSVVVLAKTNTRSRTWGTRVINTFGDSQIEKLNIGIEWIRQNGYYEVWANRDFVIYKLLSEASSTSNIARSLEDRGCNGE